MGEGEVCISDPMVRNFTTLRWGHHGGVEGVDHGCLSSMGSPRKVSAPPSLLKLLPVALFTSLPLCAWVLDCQSMPLHPSGCRSMALLSRVPQ